MTPPQLTFFCELDPEPLKNLFSQQTIDDLLYLGARVSLGIVDMSEERTGVIRQLNQAGVPVIAWLLLPMEKGYWFNIDNSKQAQKRYEAFKEWTLQNNLHWSGLGMDIEPDIREMNQFIANKSRMLPIIGRRIFDRERLETARADYTQLVNEMHADGFLVECYQFPIIVDERLVGSTLLQRVSGLVDIPVDREVWMLYSSFLRPNSVGFIASYAPQAQSLAVGSTGGGVDVPILDHPPLSWDELARDLRLSWYWCDEIYIFSLEGCIQQGFLPKLKDFEWDYPMLLPLEGTARVEAWRRRLRTGLWLSTHTTAILVILGGGLLLWKGIKRYLRRRGMRSG